LDEFNVFETMSVDGKRPESSRSAHEIMTGIPDHQSHIILSRKINSSLNMLFLRRHDNIFREVTDSASVAGIGGWPARVVSPESPEVADLGVSGPKLIGKLAGHFRTLSSIIRWLSFESVVADCRFGDDFFERATDSIVQCCPLCC